MNKPAGILESKKDKARAITLGIAIAISIFFFFFALEQRSEVKKLKAQLEECKTSHSTDN